MTLNDALTQLRIWCEQSNGHPIELLTGKTGVFESRSVYGANVLSLVEDELGWAFPDSYRQFMNVIGASTLFSWSTQGGGPRFYTPKETIEVSKGAAYRDDNGNEHRFCFIGEHRLMGDFMGFLISRTGDENFDVFCHEYPFEEYVAVSDEIKSWRTFERWLIRCVESRGEDTL